VGRGECIPQHLHDGLSFDSRSMACPLSLPSSLPFPRLHHLFEPMPHVTLLWSSEIYCVPKLLKFCVSEILCFMVPTWRHSHMPAAVCRFGRLHHENMASYRRRFQVAVALFSVLECVLRAFCMLVSLSVRTLFVSLLSPPLLPAFCHTYPLNLFVRNMPVCAPSSVRLVSARTVLYALHPASNRPL
jgi:hypothetical protein